MWICRFCGAEVQADWDVCWNCTRVRDGAPTTPLPPHAASPAPRSRFHTGVCPRCESTQVIPGVVLVALRTDTPVTLGVLRNPDALLFRQYQRSAIDTWVCGQCGYTESYARDPQQLWDAYQAALQGTPRMPIPHRQRVYRFHPGRGRAKRTNPDD